MRTTYQVSDSFSGWRGKFLGALRLGLAGSYGKLQFDPNAPDGWSEGNLGVGKLSGIATWQARAGWYLDAIVTGDWFSGNIGTPASPQAAALSGSPIGASLEGGWPIGLGWQKLAIEPQYGTAIQVGGGITGMLTTRLAVHGDVAYQHEVSNGGFRGWAFNGGARYSFREKRVET